MSLFCSILFSSFIFQFINLTTAQPKFDFGHCFNDYANYTNTSTYYTNLKILLSNLTSDTRIDYGFYNFSYGQSPDRVSAIGLCRGDVKGEDCIGCLKNATTLLPMRCPNQMEAIGGYSKCIVRYTNRSIFGVYDTPSFSMYKWNNQNATNPGNYSQSVRDLLDKLRGKAADGDWRVKFAAGNETAASYQRAYAAAQCSPDLSKQDCTDCLVRAISEIPNCCDTKIGGRIIKLSCNIRFESNLFYDPEDSNSSPTPQPSPSLLLPPPPQASPPNSSRGTCEKSRTVIVMVVPIVVLFLLVVSMTESFSCSFF